MSSTDTSLGVINSMTEAYLESLKDSSGKVASLANQLIMTPDNESSNPFPVGAIYMSPESTSPASLFGGTWTQQTSITVVSETKIKVQAETETGYVRTKTTSGNSSSGATRYLQTYQWDDYNGNGLINGSTFDFSNLYAYPSTTKTIYVWKRTA